MGLLLYCIYKGLLINYLLRKTRERTNEIPWFMHESQVKQVIACNYHLGIHFNWDGWGMYVAFIPVFFFLVITSPIPARNTLLILIGSFPGPMTWSMELVALGGLSEVRLATLWIQTLIFVKFLSTCVVGLHSISDCFPSERLPSPICYCQ